MVRHATLLLAAAGVFCLSFYVFSLRWEWCRAAGHSVPFCIFVAGGR